MNEPSKHRHSPLFVGPKGEYAEDFTSLWNHLLSTTMARRAGRFRYDPDWRPAQQRQGQHSAATIEAALEELLALLKEEIPTFSPRYLGHMVSDISIPGLLGHVAMVFENPNLASREAAMVASKLETDAINLLAEMVGLDPTPTRGHFTSGGTMANFEAVWRARYRLDHWLAMASFLRIEGHANDSLTQLAHCGWSRFEELRAETGFTDQDLMPYSAVLQGPLAADRRLREKLGEPWPEPVMLVPGNKHYSWPKAANVFGMGADAVWPCALDAHGRLNPESVGEQIDRAIASDRPVMMVVSVAGTTELGMVDPVDEVNVILQRYREDKGLHIWHHVDAAYGGYLCSTLRNDAGSCQLSQPVQRALNALPGANSITLDPHKLGFIPYACGAFLVPDTASYSVSSIHAPYLEKAQDVKFPGWSTTLEGSRAATGPSAVWLSAKVMPLNAHGHGGLLNQSLKAAADVHRCLEEASGPIRLLPAGDTNVVCFALAKDHDSLAEANQRTESLLSQFKASPELSVTRTHLGLGNYGDLVNTAVAQWNGTIDDDHLTVVRMVVMNPYLDDDIIVDGIKATLLDCLNRLV
jgi:glutamate/tyrosine decarboxylase-like PLP-dependent enzyme